jgi:hypothetical protein
MLKYFSHSFVFVTALAVSIIPLEPNSNAYGQKYTPEHPVVQEMVSKGMGFLAKSSGGSDGQTMLIGYCAFKVLGEPNDPLVARGVSEALALSRKMVAADFHPEEAITYVAGVAAMLLASVDVDKYGNQIKIFRDYLLRSQKANGGFGYPSGSNAMLGDLSQTQYAMLGLWTIDQVGIEVPAEPVARAMNFIISAQTQVGSWPYMSDGKGNASGEASHSQSSAGLSALLIGGDLLGLFRSKMQENQEEEGIIPIAFRRIVSEDKEKEKKQKISFDKNRLEASSKRGENYFNNTPYTRSTYFHYYYIYSRERFEAFLEIAKGKQTKSPEWYNDGVKMLMDSQGTGGGWGTKPGDTTIQSAEAATCFAILFLIRSTQKTIGDLSEAFNKGIGELPDDIRSITTAGGKIVNKNEANSIDDALKMLEEDGKAEGEDSLAPDRMLLSEDPKQRKEQINRFVRLLNARDFKARQIAAKMLGRSDDLDVVPALIYAIEDPDPRVPFLAEQSLRLISRQFETSHLPKKEKLMEQDKARAALQWKKWYQGIRPDYLFVN